MYHHLKAPLPIAGIEVSENVHQVGMLLVVMMGNPKRTIPLAERQNERGQVVSKVTVVYARGAQEVTHHDVQEQPLARHHHAARRHQLVKQFGRIEQGVGTFLHQPLFQFPAPLGRTSAQHQEHQLQIA